MSAINDEGDSRTMRRIRTARTKDEINEAAREGYRPLVRLVEASPDIHSKFRVVQNRLTGEVEIQGDYRSAPPTEDWEVVIDWRDYYPHAWKTPYAAYLLPPDLQIGERVILEDLIEDMVETVWNQGDAFRLKSCKAIWNGLTFEMDRSRTSPAYIVG